MCQCDGASLLRDSCSLAARRELTDFFDIQAFKRSTKKRAGRAAAARKRREARRRKKRRRVASSSSEEGAGSAAGSADGSDAEAAAEAALDLEGEATEGRAVSRDMERARSDPVLLTAIGLLGERVVRVVLDAAPQCLVAAHALAVVSF